MPRRLVAVLAIALALVLAVALVGCEKKSGASADLNLDKGTAASKSGQDAGTGGSEGAQGTSGQKATDPAGEEPVASSGSGTGGSTTGGTSGSKSGSSGSATKGGTGSTSASAKGILIKVLWWNDTQERSPENPEIVFGTKSYKPAAGKSDSGVIGPCAIGKPLTLTVYPDGRSGAKLIAKFQVTAQMIANSEQDAIHVEIKDTGVRVLGNPVNNFVQSFSRP